MQPDVQLLCAVYCYYIFFSTLAPGAPGYMPPEGTFRELFNESLNYFYINIFLNAVHLPGIPANAVSACALYSSATRHACMPHSRMHECFDGGSA